MNRVSQWGVVISVSWCVTYQMLGSLLLLGFLICCTQVNFWKGSEFVPSLSILCINWALNLTFPSLSLLFSPDFISVMGACVSPVLCGGSCMAGFSGFASNGERSPSWGLLPILVAPGCFSGTTPPCYNQVVKEQ